MISNFFSAFANDPKKKKVSVQTKKPVISTKIPTSPMQTPISRVPAGSGYSSPIRMPLVYSSTGTKPNYLRRFA